MIDASSAAARSTRSTCASAASTARRTPRELRALVEPLERAREAALETVRWTAGFDVPGRRARRASSSRSREPGEYPIERGRIVSNRGPRHRARRVRRALRRGARRALERAALAPARRGGLPRRPARALQPELRPALAARARGGARGRPRPRRAATRSGASSCAASSSCTRCDEALRIIDALRAAGRAGRRRSSRAPASATACTEAPRGLLYHRYRARRRGHDPRREDRPADVAEPAAIEDDLRGVVERNARPADDDELALRCEQAIRNYDPCISCATHFLDARGRARVSLVGRRHRQRLPRRRRAWGSWSRRAPARAACRRRTRASKHEGEPTALLDLWTGWSLAVVVDAVSERARPGPSGLRRDKAPLPSSFRGVDARIHPRPSGRARPTARPAARAVIVLGVEDADIWCRRRAPPGGGPWRRRGRRARPAPGQ